MKKWLRHTAAIAAALSLGSVCLSYGGEWRQMEGGGYQYWEDSGWYATGWREIDGGWYYFGQDGKRQTGWQEIDGRWYLLSPENGRWEPRPAITENSACHLLENALADAGLYQEEEYEVVLQVIDSSKTEVMVAVGLEELPGQYEYYNIYRIDRKTRSAVPAVKGTGVTLNG